MASPVSHGGGSSDRALSIIAKSISKERRPFLQRLREQHKEQTRTSIKGSMGSVTFRLASRNLRCHGYTCKNKDQPSAPARTIFTKRRETKLQTK